jgi:hypothetical protein
MKKSNCKRRRPCPYRSAAPKSLEEAWKPFILQLEHALGTKLTYQVVVEFGCCAVDWPDGTKVMFMPNGDTGVLSDAGLTCICGNGDGIATTFVPRDQLDEMKGWGL